MDIADARTLFHRIHKAGGFGLPPHVAVRVHFALAGQEVVYVDAWTDGGGDRALSGRVVAFTAKHVAAVDVEDAESDEATVRLAVVSRATLERLEIGPVDGHPRANTAQTWSAYEFGGGTWPARGMVSLTYAGMEGGIVVPSGPVDNREDFAALLPSLLDDLSR